MMIKNTLADMMVPMTAPQITPKRSAAQRGSVLVMVVISPLEFHLVIETTI